MADDAFFVPDGDGWVPTVHPVGPWSADALHGGPVAALFVRAMGRVPAGPPRWPARIHVEFLRPVPRAKLEVELRLQEGRTLVRWDATMRAGHVEVARANGLLLPYAPAPEAATPPEPAGPGPEAGTAATLAWKIPYEGYHLAVDIRLLRGTVCDGPVRVWMRPRYPLVAGSPTGPLERALVVADAGSGISAVLDPRAWNFVNPNLDVASHRVPTGEWVGMDATTRVGPDGIALCETSLFDEAGAFGRSTQVLVVRKR